MLSFTDFRTKYNGKGIDFDGSFGDQCVDLMNQYCVEVLGLTSPMQVLGGPTAYQIYQNYNGTQFTKIANTPTGVPNNGDIMFWNPNVSGITGSAGHVSVYVDGDVNNFNSFDQNYPTGTLCHIQSHTYNGVAGWLRFKSPVDLQAQLDAMRKQRDDNWNLYQSALTTVNTQTGQIQALTSQIQPLKDRIANGIKALS